MITRVYYNNDAAIVTDIVDCYRDIIKTYHRMGDHDSMMRVRKEMQDFIDKAGE